MTLRTLNFWMCRSLVSEVHAGSFISPAGLKSSNARGLWWSQFWALCRHNLQEHCSKKSSADTRTGLGHNAEHGQIQWCPDPHKEPFGKVPYSGSFVHKPWIQPGPVRVGRTSQTGTSERTRLISQKHLCMKFEGWEVSE